MIKHFLQDNDFTSQQQNELLELAITMKQNPHKYEDFLRLKTVALIFDKPSTRTRFSFATAVTELGGTPIITDSQVTQIGRGETLADTAKVISSYTSAIVWRAYSQTDLVNFSQNSTVPVINALTNTFHPCQLLADLLTLLEHFGYLSGLTVSFYGDGKNNMAHSWLLAGSLAGMNIRIATPSAYEPDSEILAQAEKIAKTHNTQIVVEADPLILARKADVLVTDTWVSMGETETFDKKTELLQPYQINEELLLLANPTVQVLHCLPAHRGDEITSNVIDGSSSLVWKAARNRLFAQKALLYYLLAK